MPDLSNLVGLSSLQGRFGGGVVSLMAIDAASSYSFASASQPYNATGVSISDSVEGISTDGLLFAWDTDAGFYYWNGATRAIGDATNNGDGTYQVALSPAIDFGNTSGFIEVTAPASPATSEATAFSGGTSTPGVARFEIANEGTNPLLRIYDSGTAAYSTVDSTATGEPIVVAGHRYRTSWVYDAGQPRRIYAGGSDTPTLGNAASVPSEIVGIGYNRSFSIRPYDGTLHKVYVYDAAWTDAEAKAVLEDYKSNLGTFWIGDSFLNSAQIRDDFGKLLANSGRYFWTHQYNSGGTGLTSQASDFASNRSEHFDKTLVIVDGDLTTDDSSVTALQSIVSNLGHDRWVYVQSNPVDAAGSGQDRTDWEEEDAAILAYCGAAHYCETLSVMQANGDGGGTDNADVANDIWPTSLRAVSDSIHPNAAGQAILAQAIYDHIVAQGWLAYTVTLTIGGGGTLSVTGATDATVTGDDTATLRVSGDLADVNTELGTLAIAGLSAGSHLLTASLYDPVTGQTKQKTATVTVT